MKKALTLATLLFGMMTLTHVCQAESAPLSKTEAIAVNRSFLFFTFTLQSEGQNEASLFYLDLQESDDETYHFTFHYSAQVAQLTNLVLRAVFMAYIAFLFKKNFPLPKPQHT
jgi:hypothetical protein